MHPEIQTVEHPELLRLQPEFAVVSPIAAAQHPELTVLQDLAPAPHLHHEGHRCGPDCGHSQKNAAPHVHHDGCCQPDSVLSTPENHARTTPEVKQGGHGPGRCSCPDHQGAHNHHEQHSQPAAKPEPTPASTAKQHPRAVTAQALITSQERRQTATPQNQPIPSRPQTQNAQSEISGALLAPSKLTDSKLPIIKEPTPQTAKSKLKPKLVQKPTVAVVASPKVATSLHGGNQASKKTTMQRPEKPRVHLPAITVGAGRPPASNESAGSLPLAQSPKQTPVRANPSPNHSPSQPSQAQFEDKTPETAVIAEPEAQILVPAPEAVADKIAPHLQKIIVAAPAENQPIAQKLAVEITEFAAQLANGENLAEPDSAETRHLLAKLSTFAELSGHPQPKQLARQLLERLQIGLADNATALAAPPERGEDIELDSAHYWPGPIAPAGPFKQSVISILGWLSVLGRRAIVE